jgi:hypothetical protein
LRVAGCGFKVEGWELRVEGCGVRVGRREGGKEGGREGGKEGGGAGGGRERRWRGRIRVLLQRKLLL